MTAALAKNPSAIRANLARTHPNTRATTVATADPVAVADWKIFKEVKQMKSWKIAAVCVAGTLAAIAADMTGDYNTWLGYIAGINADGERTTVQGAGAGGEATGLIRTDLIGAAAGAYASNLYDCVGIGYRALRGSADMSEVVAIGAGAFTNKTGLSKATWLNGHFAAFGQNNTFWIKANPKQADTNAPIHFANGVLSLNADTVRINGETAGGGGGGGGTSAPVLAGYDLYVDCVNGDDSFAGTTPGTAKRTIDGAYAAVTNHDMTICLMPGEYASPGGAGADGQDYPPYRVHYIGAYGKERTIIDGGAERLFFGCSSAFTSVEGCTIRNMRGRVNRPRFFALYLYDCAVDISGGSTGYGFASCVIEKCTISGTPNFTSDDSRLFSGFFMECDVWDTVVDITAPDDVNHSPSMFYASYLENVFVLIRGSVRNLGAASDPYKSVLGNSLGLKDCTVICSQAARSFVAPPSVGCLYGLGDGATYSATTGCVCTNVETVAALIQSDYRPPVNEWRYRFVGYESAAERAVRDSMENSIVDALLKNENLNIAPTARANLLSLVVENETEAAPVVVNRSTNAAPAKVEVILPPNE
jgi:hypothetical protein